MSCVLNQVTFTGNIVRDFEPRETSGGNFVTNIEIIVDNPKSPEKKTFINATAWDKIALAMTDRLGKGSKVLINGRLATDSYFDKLLDKQSTRLIVVINDFYDLTCNKEE